MKKYRSNEEWQELIREQEESGQTAVDFCKGKAIHPNLFYRKRKDIAQENNDSHFVKLNVPVEARRNEGGVPLHINIGPIQIVLGKKTDKNQLCSIFQAALEATDAQL